MEMTKEQAKIKIEKLIRLATNSGATKSESEAAFERAEILCKKYGFKVVKSPEMPKSYYDQVKAQQPKTIVYKSVSFGLKSCYKKEVEWIFSQLGINHPNVTIVGKMVYIRIPSDKNFNVDEFRKFWKKVASSVRTERQNYKDTDAKIFWAGWRAAFMFGMRDSNLIAIKSAYDLGAEFASIKNKIYF